MQPATVAILKKELNKQTPEELIDICLRLVKFKKENKELLSYILFDAHDEDAYIRAIKEEMDTGFSQLNTNSLYFIKKGVRKNLRILKKQIRYSKKKETEAEVLLYFCTKLKKLQPAYRKSQQMINIYERQIGMVKKAINMLHEDLQYDFRLELEKLGEE